MLEDDASHKHEEQGSNSWNLHENMADALDRGDHDTLLELAHDYLEVWPRQKIRNSYEWYILAMLSQVGADHAGFGLAGEVISRKVALTARLSLYETSNRYDMICRTVALSVYEEVPMHLAIKCLTPDEVADPRRVLHHMENYASSRLGLAAWRQGNRELLELCVKCSQNLPEVAYGEVDFKLETALLECYLAMLHNHQPDLDGLIDLLRLTSPRLRQRYYRSVRQIVDEEDLMNLWAC